jgi:Right handed beta helix region
MIPYVSPEDFGAEGDGVTDDTLDLQEAVDFAANRTLVLSGTYLISAPINLPSNIEIIGTGTAEVVIATPDLSLFAAQLQSDIRIRNIRFVQTAFGDDPYTGGVVLDQCTDCLVADCEFEGMQWAGVYLSRAHRNEIRGNYFHDFYTLGANDSADILVYNDSSDNRIADNRCFGGANHGILLQDPYNETPSTPVRNLISGNHVGQHEAYGIVVYVPYAGSGPFDSFNTIVGNDVEDILGSRVSYDGETPLYDTGAGIYIVGGRAGGTLVANNNIRNCCQQTTTRSLAPGAIGIAGLPAGAARVVISGNDIADMAQGDGIHVASSPGGATINGNAIRMPATNNGAGPGGVGLTGAGIRVEASSNVAMVGNTLTHAGTGGGLLVYANGTNQTDFVVSGNILTTTAVAPLRVVRTDSFTTSGCAITGNTCRTSGAVDGVQLEGIAGGTLSGNTVSCGGIAAYVSACTDLRISGNSLATSGGTGAHIGGTCTGTFYALSNRCSGAIVNAGSGSRTEFFTTAVPASGTAAVGDRAVQSAPTSGAPDYWRCVTAGSPGTWKAGANLA